MRLVPGAAMGYSTRPESAQWTPALTPGRALPEALHRTKAPLILAPHSVVSRLAHCGVGVVIGVGPGDRARVVVQPPAAVPART